MNLEKRVAIVTGAGSDKGIGRSIAIYLAQKGADVVVADLNEEGIKATVEQIGAFGKRAIGVQVDVSDEDSVNKMVEKTLKEFGKIDILVNNAGVSQPVKLIDTTTTDWDRIMSVNLKGTFICSKAVLKPMMEQKYGRIVSISSQAGKAGGGFFGGAHYAASKAGVLGLSKTLAKEVAEYGITVNCICPGTIDTNIRVGISTEKENILRESSPMKRFGKSLEIAYGVAFLASEEASYITGEDIDINGGSYID